MSMFEHFVQLLSWRVSAMTDDLSVSKLSLKLNLKVSVSSIVSRYGSLIGKRNKFDAL